jgi:hypothetical protein
MLAVWTGTRGNLVSAGCNDDIGYVNGVWDRDSILSIPASSGVTYFIEVSTFNGYIDINEASATESEQKQADEDYISSMQSQKIELDKNSGLINDLQSERSDEVSTQFWGGTLQLHVFNRYTISGNAGVADVVLSYVDETMKTISTDSDGNYQLIVPYGWSGMITPYKSGYKFSPISNTYAYLQSDQPNQDFLPQVCENCKDINVTIGGASIGNYSLADNESIRQNYPIIDAGPVVVQSVDGSDIVVALREMWNSQATGTVLSTSFAQLMGIAKERLSDTYYLPHYNDLSPYLDAQLRFGNVDSIPTKVTITIGGVDYGPFPSADPSDNLDPGESYRINFPDIDAGPVVVTSSNGAKIVVALREMWNSQATGLVDSTSFTQIMGIPKEELTDTYYLPHYNDLSPYLDAQLRFGIP